MKDGVRSPPAIATGVKADGAPRAARAMILLSRREGERGNLQN